MPVLTPAELWEASGRLSIPEVFRLEDRAGREFVLPMTHEETVTFHASEIQSYRELPQILYHFSTKDRDEPRPRGGLLRVREFIMKDSYSFDRDEEGLDRAFEAHRGAYERIFERCGIVAVGVEAESGMMGGSESVDFLAPSGSGENTLVTCERGDFAADLEVARGVPRHHRSRSALDEPQEVETPGVATIEALADVPRHRPGRDVEGDAGDDGGRHASCSPSCAATTGWSRTSSPPRSARPHALRPMRRSGRPSAPRAAPSARSASTARSSPTRRCATASSSRARTATAGTCAGSRTGATSSRASPTCARPSTATLSRLWWQPPVRDGDRGRAHLQARHPLLAAVRRDVPRRGRQRAAARDGQLRHRPRPRARRRRRAAPRRARHRLARAIAPYDAHVLSLAGRDAAVDALADRGRGDARCRRAAPFCSTTATSGRARSSPTPTSLGVPVRVTVGKKSLEDGAVDVRARTTGRRRARAARDP